MTKQGRNLEGFVHYVYSAIMKIEDTNSNTLVSSNVKIRGRSGENHEFDVYYEFTKTNVKHRVAIECKDHITPVTKGMVSEFWGKISDIDNVAGVIVSRSGFQSGAKGYAEHYGISLLSVEELPTLPEILALQIKTAFLPDSSIVGQPFWMLMEQKDGEVTGTYTCLPSPHGDKNVPLFFSKRIAMDICNQVDPVGSTVRGVNQIQLKILIGFARNFDLNFLIIPFKPDENRGLFTILFSPDEIERDYIIN